MKLLAWLCRQGACRRLFILLTVVLGCSGAFAQTTNNYQHLLNLNFGASGSGTKTGWAAIGNNTNDNWNLLTVVTNVDSTYTYYMTSYTVPAAESGTFTNLVWANGTNTTISIALTNLISSATNGSPDTMFNSYLYAPHYMVQDYYVPVYIYGDPKVVISNMPTGTYDIYIYGMGGTYYDNQGYNINIGTNSATSTKYTSYPSPFDANWTEGYHYIRFTNQVVNTGDTLTVNWATPYNYYAINGIQIVDLSSTNTDTTLPGVTFDPVSGTTVPVSVTMYVTNHSGVTIYYTTDGSTPTTNSTVYSSPVSLSAATTVKAFATQSGYTDTSVATASYPLPTAPAPSVSPVTASYESSVDVTMSTSLTGGTIRYTINGTDWYDYTTTLTFTTTTTVIAKTIKTGYNDSSTTTRTYTIYYPDAPSPTVSPGGGAYQDAVSVTLSSSLSGASYKYKINGGSWQDYSSALTIDGATTLIAKTVKTGYNDSASVTNVYTFSVPALSIIPNGGFFTNSTLLAITNALTSAQIQYSLDNGATWSNYTNAFVLDGIWSGSGFIQVKATKTGYTECDTNTYLYYFVTQSPDYSYASGHYTNTLNLAITSGTTNATLEYSLNFFDWTVYTNTVAITNDAMIYARASKAGYFTSGQTDYFASDGFSTIQGLGNWFYLYSTVAQGSPDTYLPIFDTDLVAWRATNDPSCYIAVDNQRPGATNDSVRTFVCPSAGSITINNWIVNSDTSTNDGNGVWVRILQNTNALVDWTYITNSPAATNFFATATVAVGDTIYFQVNAGTNSDADITQWNPLITYNSSRIYYINDTDEDGLADGTETTLGTNLNNIDSDGDGVSDYLEWLIGRNPLVAGAVADSSNLTHFEVYTPLEH